MRIVKSIENEREALGNILKDLAEYYRVTLSDKQVEMYTDDLIELGPELTMKAALKYRQTWGNAQFPLPAILRGAIHYGLYRESVLAGRTSQNDLNRKNRVSILPDLQ